MTTTILKYLLRAALWLASRHRSLGIRDWIASCAAILILAFGLAWPALLNLYQRFFGAENSTSLPILCTTVAAIAIVAWVPVSYILKLRRIGITDADYSTATGIDYAAALESAKNGFSFGGVSGSKLKDKETEFRNAVKSSVQHGKPIRMLLLDPKSKAFSSLESMDNTTGYRAKATGSLSFFGTFQNLHQNHFEVKYYSAEQVEKMMPFRIFLTDEDCLLSPFIQGRGENDQGRGLPQLRITSKSFPKGIEPTLYTAFFRYFEENWRAAHSIEEEKNDE